MHWANNHLNSLELICLSLKLSLPRLFKEPPSLFSIERKRSFLESYSVVKIPVRLQWIRMSAIKMKNSVTFSTFARTFSIVILQPTAALNFHNLKTKQLINQQSAKLELMERKQLSSGSPPMPGQKRPRWRWCSNPSSPDPIRQEMTITFVSLIFFPIYFSGSWPEGAGDGAGGAPGVRLRLRWAHPHGVPGQVRIWCFRLIFGSYRSSRCANLCPSVFLHMQHKVLFLH